MIGDDIVAKSTNTAMTVAAVRDLMLKWSPAERRGEFIADLYRLIETAVRECEGYVKSQEVTKP